MSYYATFKPTEEAAEKLKTWMETDKAKEWLADAENEIVVKCMTKNSGKDVQTTAKELRFILNQIALYGKSISRNGSYEQYQEDKTVWFCGWQYSRPWDAPDMSEAEKYVLQELLLYTFVVPTPDYFKNSEQFYDKVSDIKSKIEYFLESATEAENFNIMEELKDFRLGDEDDCGEDVTPAEDSEETKQDVMTEPDEGFVEASDVNSVAVTDEGELQDATSIPSPQQVPSWFNKPEK